MSNLFTEVSVEQLETVAGGAPAQAFQFTQFAGVINGLGAAGSSGPNGTTGTTSGVSDKRLTQGLNAVTLDSPVLPAIIALPYPVI